MIAHPAHLRDDLVWDEYEGYLVREDCGDCCGTGEGMHESVSCSRCRGRGSVLVATADVYVCARCGDAYCSGSVELDGAPICKACEWVQESAA